MDGLTIKDGRLINERRPSETGIATAAIQKAKMKGSKVVRNIADGIELSEERKVMKEIFGPVPKSFFK